jgi:hypothetical protein
MAQPKAKPLKFLASTKKSPVARQPAGEAGSRPPVFHFEYADVAFSGDFGFHQDPECSHDILALILDASKKSWNELLAERVYSGGQSHKKHHSQVVATLEAGARQRITDRKLDEVFGDDIFRFRDGNMKRMWGFRDGQDFYVLWWDPNHLVYPVDKD